MTNSTAVRTHRSTSGGKRRTRAQAVGLSRGGRTTRIDALGLPRGRQPAFLLTGGQVAGGTAADRLPVTNLLRGNKDYDNAGGRWRGPSIPPRASRRWQNRFFLHLYRNRNRNLIERLVGRLKDFHRISTRYDRSAANVMAAIHIAATVAYWL